MSPAISLKACDCLTPFGRARESHAALCDGQRSLELRPIYTEGTEKVPLALIGNWEEAPEGRWYQHVVNLLKDTTGTPWGDARHPVIITSSNFGIGQLYSFVAQGMSGPLEAASPERAVAAIAEACAWGPNRMIVSNACVSAQLGLMQAARLLGADLADEVLVFSFDFLSPFVAGGFHSLKILNEAFPHPYCQSEAGSIGLGDGAAYAILGKQGAAEWELASAASWNECYHMTGNDPSGAGFRECMQEIAKTVGGRPVWLKGHGTGTLEAGSLEVATAEAVFSGAPLVSWKGSLGHTLGSCGLVELAIAKAAMEAGQAPGSSQATAETLSSQVAREPFRTQAFEGVVMGSSAFGGAHAAHFLHRTPTGGGDTETTFSRVKYIRSVECLTPTQELSSEALSIYRKAVPMLAARRMTHLPLMLAEVTLEARISPEDELVFASEYGGVQALEKFLESFPLASPIGFQNSTQPGPASLVLVARKQPVRLFTPVVGKEALSNSLLLALLSPKETVHLLGGEESGTWLTEKRLASEQAFAYYLEVCDSEEGAMGRIEFTESHDGSIPCSTQTFTESIHARKSISVAMPSGGSTKVQWL